MEADSTTYDNNSKNLADEPDLPFAACPWNIKLYKDFITKTSEKNIESHVIEKLKTFGLLQKKIKCPTNKTECNMICRAAKVIDRLQWACESCGKRMPVRTGSFFLRLQCSIVQALQIILAWCEDADCNVVAEHFGVKPKVANLIYDRLDDLAIKELKKCQLGGENCVVLAEMYPDCLNRLSPDTTDQPHVHRILMLADTNHIPTYYRLHVIKDDYKKQINSINLNNQALKFQVEEAVLNMVVPNSTIVTGNNVPTFDGASSIQQLAQYCDADMQHFLSSRIWRQAVSVCSAARELCASAPSGACAAALQRYADSALYRLRYGDGFYRHILNILVTDYTDKMY